MSFAVGAEAYDRFMGRYSVPLASIFAEFADVPEAGRVLDVGCGTGALTDVLIARVGVDHVTAADPSTSFVTSLRLRQPGLVVEETTPGVLPFDSAEFDATLAQLVVHFMSDPVAEIAEMARVTRPDGIVAACVWDHAEGGGPLAEFWSAVHDLDPTVPGEGDLPGTSRGELGELFGHAGLRDIEESELSVSVAHAGFDEWWEPFTFGVGPAGAHVKSLDSDDVESLRARCMARLPDGPFEIRARAWAARGRAS